MKKELKYSNYKVNCQSCNLLSTNCARDSFLENKKKTSFSKVKRVERRNIGVGSYRCMEFFDYSLSWRMQLFCDMWDHVIDFSISRTSLAVQNQMLAVLKVALGCVSVVPEARLKMKSVLRMLLNARKGLSSSAIY